MKIDPEIKCISDELENMFEFKRSVKDNVYRCHNCGKYHFG
jgi:hypothetical protein